MRSMRVWIPAGKSGCFFVSRTGGELVAFLEPAEAGTTSVEPLEGGTPSAERFRSAKGSLRDAMREIWKSRSSARSRQAPLRMRVSRSSIGHLVSFPLIEIENDDGQM